MKKGKELLRGCLPYLIWLGVCGLLALLFQIFKGNRPLMNWLAENVTSPVKTALASFCNLFPFSVSEIVIYLVIIGAVIFLVKAVLAARRQKGNRTALLLRRGLALGAAALTAYTMFVCHWGINYYTDTFQEKSGIHAAAPTVEQLYQTARYFARGLNAAGKEVRRDEKGLFAEDMKQVIADSADLYTGIEEKIPCLSGKVFRPKPFFLSEILSYLDCTGYYFPWLGESNFNNHSPASDRPATIAHELAHQRNVASEQEANFVAVLVSLESDSAAYRYSGYMLGYVYLNNALIQADEVKWREVYSTLSPEVRADMANVNEYWKAHTNWISKAASGMNDQRLKNYGQELGIRSYGAVVDLLTVYYGPAAAQDE